MELPMDHILLWRVKSYLPPNARCTLYSSLILSRFEYADIIWGRQKQYDTDEITSNSRKQSCENYHRCSSVLLRNWGFENLNWTQLKIRRHKHQLIFKCINNLIDFDFELTRNSNIHNYNTRTSNNLHLPKAKTNWETKVNLPSQQRISITWTPKQETLTLYINSKSYSIN